MVGSGIYATNDYSLAYTFTEENNEPYRNSKSRIIQFNIEETDILQLNYVDAAAICDIGVNPCEWEYSVDRLPNIKEYVLHKGYKGVEIIYLNISEFCIYDSSIIHNIKRSKLQDVNSDK